MQDALHVGEPLQGVEAGNGEGIGAGAQHLEGAAGPATPLDHHGPDREGRHPRTQLLRHIQPAVARRHQPESCGQILRGGAGVEATHRLQGRAAHHEGGAGAHHGPQPLTGGLHPAVERLLVGHQPALQAQIAHQGVGPHVGLGGLHEPHGRVAEQPHRPAQKRDEGHHIRIKHRDQVGLHMAQPMVEIARFGMGTIAPGQVTDPHLGAALTEFVPIGVVQQPHRNVGVVEGPHTPQAAKDHLQRFPTGGNEHGHGRKTLRSLQPMGLQLGSGSLHLLASIRSAQRAHPHHQQAVPQQQPFSQQQQHAESGREGRVEMERAADAPGDVAQAQHGDADGGSPSPGRSEGGDHRTQSVE